MKHLIIGAGNLGIDIKNEIIRQNGDRRSVELVSLSNGFDVRDLDSLALKVREQEFDYIWYAVGQGSVMQAKENIEDAKTIYGRACRTIILAAKMTTKLVFFSTDYVANEDEPGNHKLITTSYVSDYEFVRAQSEIMMLGIDRPLSTIIRLGSLYGTHKPLNTFPGRLLKNFGTDVDIRVRLPQNLVTPTPSLWLASVLVTHIDLAFDETGMTRHHCAPTGNISCLDWGKFVLEGIREPSAFSADVFYDEERPKISALGASFLPENFHWHELWKVYFKPDWYQVPEGQDPELPIESDPTPTEPDPAGEPISEIPTPPAEGGETPA